MNKLDFFKGFIMGLLVSLLGCFLFITLFTDFNFLSGVEIMKSEGKLGKLITLGSILDLFVFALLLRMNKDMMARGVILAVLCLALISILA